MRYLLIMIGIGALLQGCTNAYRETQAMSDYTRHYNFVMNDENAGYFTIVRTDDIIEMNAIFQMDGQMYENPFSLQLTDNDVVAYRVGDGAWIPVQNPASTGYPTSAYPILIDRANPQYTYSAIHEGSGEVLGETDLKRDGDVITETRAGKIIRTFVMDGSIPVTIHWGGAVSHLKDSEEEAKRGSPLE